VFATRGRCIGRLLLAIPARARLARGERLEFRPWTETTKMEAGVWNIPQPAEGPRVSPSVLVVPLLGFDEAGYRLGYGAGYYDMTLASMAPRPFTVGVGFESASLPTIHPMAHDVPLDVIVTEERKRLFRSGDLPLAPDTAAFKDHRP
jgi:5-formyltetrahydrofolate cyclo-ligase